MPGTTGNIPHTNAPSRKPVANDMGKTKQAELTHNKLRMEHNKYRAEYAEKVHLQRAEYTARQRMKIANSRKKFGSPKKRHFRLTKGMNKMIEEENKRLEAVQPQEKISKIPFGMKKRLRNMEDRGTKYVKSKNPQMRKIKAARDEVMKILAENKTSVPHPCPCPAPSTREIRKEKKQ